VTRRSANQLTLRTTGADDTRDLAGAVAGSLVAGDTVVLTGELGAGKTCFVQGAAAALGVSRPVTSPTFTIVRSYQGVLPIVHVDVYRLEEVQEFVELGEDTVLTPEQVTFIEWGDTLSILLPEDRLEVEILLGEKEDERIVHLRGAGMWRARIADLVPALQAWLLEDPYPGEAG
jgi:tRNA threonylcarbamoyladenosine biosynthesis protein TsaE